MTGTSTLDTFLTRICAMQAECIPGSVANKGVSVTSNNLLYWTNFIRRLATAKLDPSMARYDVTVEMQLRRNVDISGGADLQEETKCYADMLTVCDYFMEYPSLTTSTLTTPPTDIVPHSVGFTCEGVKAIDVGDKSIWGSVYTLTFTFNRRHFPRR